MIIEILNFIDSVTKTLLGVFPDTFTVWSAIYWVLLLNLIAATVGICAEILLRILATPQLYITERLSPEYVGFKKFIKEMVKLMSEHFFEMLMTKEGIICALIVAPILEELLFRIIPYYITITFFPKYLYLVIFILSWAFASGHIGKVTPFFYSLLAWKVLMVTNNPLILFAMHIICNGVVIGIAAGISALYNYITKKE